MAQARFANRAEAIRMAIESLVDTERRRAAGEAIVAGYLRQPQGDDEVEAAVWPRRWLLFRRRVLSITATPR